MRGIKIGYGLLNHIGIFRDIMQFRIISRRKSTSRNSRVIQISSQKRFQQTTLSDPGNISGPLRGKWISDLVLLRTLVICRMSLQPSFGEVIVSLVLFA